jgi:hypothetical protein
MELLNNKTLMFKTNENRNYDKVQFEGVRKVVDPQINNLHDELSTCYYTYWKHGQSRPFTVGAKTWDVQATPEDSLMLFQKLQIAIHHTHTIKLDEENASRKKEDRDAGLTSLMHVRRLNRDGQEEETPLETAQRVLTDLKAEGIEIIV